MSRFDTTTLVLKHETTSHPYSEVRFATDTQPYVNKIYKTLEETVEQLIKFNKTDIELVKTVRNSVMKKYFPNIYHAKEESTQL